MIRLYTSPGSQSCRKARNWLNQHKMSYIEKNIFSSQLQEDELREFLERSENGTDDIVSMRSKVFKSVDVDIDHMSVQELIRFIQENPSVLKRPIIMDEKRFLVGYNDEEIRAFMPKAMRQAKMKA